ncbi:MAG: response regulator [Candidatus Saccharimonadales bacterium]
MSVHVLLVEDDAWLGELYAQLLYDVGFTTKVVSDGHSAIEAIDTQLPQVIILDMLLTGGTGIALLHELQSYVDTATIPIIVCSSIGVTMPAVDMTAYGVTRILDKTTMHPNDIVTAVRSVMI